MKSPSHSLAACRLLGTLTLLGAGPGCDGCGPPAPPPATAESQSHGTGNNIDNNNRKCAPVTGLTMERWPEPTKVWSHQGKLAIYSSPRLAELNGDGVLDVVVGHGVEYLAAQAHVRASAGYALALDGKTGAPLWQRKAREALVGSARFVDVNKDGQDDVVIGGRNATLMAVHGGTGQMLWEFMPSGDPKAAGWYNFYSPAVVEDDNGDGVPELLLANGGDASLPPTEHNRPTGRIVLIDASNGEVLRYGEMPDGAETYMSPLVADFGRRRRLIFGSGGETLAGGLWWNDLDGLADLSSAQKLQRGERKGVLAPPSLADMDGDGTLDVVSSNMEGELAAISGENGQPLWRIRLGPLESISSPTLGFFDGDGTPDVFATFTKGSTPDYGGAVHVVVSGGSGKELLRFEQGVWTASGAVAVDMNGDGLDEVLFGVNTHGLKQADASLYQLFVLDMASGQRRRYGRALDKLSYGQPWVGDMDGDGCLDVVVPHSDGLAGEMSHGSVTRLDTHLPAPGSVSWGAYMGNAYDGHGPAQR